MASRASDITTNAPPAAGLDRRAVAPLLRPGRRRTNCIDVILREYVAGSALATDLVLTAAGHTAEDRLASPVQLAALLDAHGIDHGPVDETQVDETLALRDELLTLFRYETDEDMIDAASAILTSCPHRLRAGKDHTAAPYGDWRLTPTEGASTIERVRLVVGAGLLSVLHALGTNRFRGCASPQCAGKFIDTSNSGRRRYCLPRICGNRVNVARNRARRSGDRTPDSSPWPRSRPDAAARRAAPRHMAGEQDYCFIMRVQCSLARAPPASIPNTREAVLPHRPTERTGMQISVNPDRCEGHGLCEEQAPEVFELDDDGYLINHYDGVDLPSELEKKAERAAGVCPVAALTVER